MEEIVEILLLCKWVWNETWLVGSNTLNFHNNALQTFRILYEAPKFFWRFLIMFRKCEYS